MPSFPKMEEDIKPGKPLLHVNLDKHQGHSLLPVKTEKVSQLQMDLLTSTKEEKSPELQPCVGWEEDNMNNSKDALPCIDLERNSGGVLACVSSQEYGENGLNAVRVKQLEMVMHNEPFPVSLVKCERIEEADSTSYSLYIQDLHKEHSKGDAPGQLGERFPPSPPIQSSLPTFPVKLGEGGDGRNCAREAPLSGKTGKPIQLSLCLSEDFRVVLNPDYVEEEDLESEEGRELQPLEGDVCPQTDGDSLLSNGLSLLHEHQWHQSVEVHVPGTSSMDVAEACQSLACTETTKSSSLEEAWTGVQRPKEDVNHGWKDTGFEWECEGPKIDSLHRDKVTVHEGTQTLFSCFQCDFKSDGKNQLNAHVRIVHSSIKKYSCAECKYRSAKKGNLTAHIEAVHRRLMRYSCPSCEYRCTLKAHLTRHMKGIHSDRKRYACRKCEYRSAWNSDLKAHVENVHNSTKTFACPDCEFQCGTRSSLKVHRDTVHGGRALYSCPECKYRSIQKSEVDEHFKTVHRGEKNYSCPSCKFKTGWKSNLKKHTWKVHRRDGEKSPTVRV